MLYITLINVYTVYITPYSNVLTTNLTNVLVDFSVHYYILVLLLFFF